MRQLCAHCPRLALRCWSASLVRHWPLQLTQSAPWTKHSSSRSVRADIARISSIESSRGSTTRVTPRVCAIAAASAGDVRQGLLGDGQLAIEDQGVEGDEALHAFRMEELEDARQVGGGEVVRARPGVEAAAQAEIDGVCARGHRGPEALLVPGGREQLRLFKHFRHGKRARLVTAEVSWIR